MRAVVTGGAGFIGSHLIEALVARGDEVVCVERPGAPRRWLEGLDLSYRDSGLDNERALSAAFAGADVVFHLAGLTEARAPFASPRRSSGRGPCTGRASAACSSCSGWCAAAWR